MEADKVTQKHRRQIFLVTLDGYFQDVSLSFDLGGKYYTFHNETKKVVRVGNGVMKIITVVNDDGSLNVIWGKRENVTVTFLEYLDEWIEN
jgi:hypothetical protein